MPWFVALWSKPEDTEAFERHYREVHVPLVEENWPGLRRSFVVRATGALWAEEPDWYLAFAAEVDDLDALMESDAIQATAEDAQTMMERFGVSARIVTGESL